MSVLKNILLGLLLLLGLGVLLARAKIQTTECYLTNAHECPAELQTKLQERLVGSSLVFSQLDDTIRSNVQLPGYVFSSYKRYFPSKVAVWYTPESVLYAMTFAEGETVLISESGAVIPENESQPTDGQSPELVQVVAPHFSLPAEQTMAPPALHQAIAPILTTLAKTSIHVVAITWENEETIILELARKPSVLLDVYTPQERIAALPALFSEPEYLEMQGQVVEIDLRFELPVLRTGQ